MKTRANKAYLVIAGIHLGHTPDILKVFAHVAFEYKADVIHLGQLTTQEEKKMYETRVKRIRTWEKIAKVDPKLAQQKAKLYNSDADDIDTLLNAQYDRVEVLQQYFGAGLTLVINDEQFIGKIAHSTLKIVKNHLALSRHLNLESVSANGERISHSPITERSFNYFRSKGQSFIVPHPSPVLRSFHKPELNKAHNFYTTGCLKVPDDIMRPSEYYKATNLPSAILVLVDSQNGEFHARRLHVDFDRDAQTHRQSPVVIEDGRAFTINGIKELGSDDKAVHCTDDHAPYEHLGVLACVRALNGLHKPSVFINGGDAGDWSSVCPHNIGNPLSQEGRRLIDDEKAVQRLLRTQVEGFKSIKRKVLLDANHEFWVTRNVRKNPALVGKADLESFAKGFIPEWDMFIRKSGEPKIFTFGDLTIRHGDRDPGLEGGRRIFVKYLCGHWHSHNESGRAASAGAGCKTGPEYLENGITSWQNTVTSVTKYKEKTSFDIKSVLHDEAKKVSRFAYRGQIIEVSFHQY